jgi:hypothetical protein
MKSLRSCQLRYGPYASPRFRLGSTVADSVRGDVVIVALSDTRIPWPLGRVNGNSNRALILCGDLARAVRRESAQAIASWWGMTAQTVSKWRKALGVVGPTDGERELRAELGRRNWKRVGPKLMSKSQDPKRRAKIVAAKIGKPRSPSTVEKMRRAATGRKASSATKCAMSTTHRKRGTRPPWLKSAWTAADDALLAKLPSAQVAKRTDRTLQAVYQRRSLLRRTSLATGRSDSGRV